MKLIAYTRLSQANAHEGESHDAQLKRITAWAEDHGHELVAHCVDTVSGENGVEDRPGFVDALELLDAGDADGIAVATMDRLARKLATQEALLAAVWKRDAAAFDIGTGEIARDDSDDPYRVFVRQVMGAASQLERALIVKRMTSGRKRAIAEGKIIGGGGWKLAYGWTRGEGDVPVPVPEEIGVVAEAARRRNDGGASLRAVAQYLMKATGRQWSPTQAKRVLDRYAKWGDSV